MLKDCYTRHVMLLHVIELEFICSIPGEPEVLSDIQGELYTLLIKLHIYLNKLYIDLSKYLLI